jgi:gliding motility-associated-like protein
MKFFFSIAFLALFILSNDAELSAQLEFTMSDTTVTECKGILYDNGGESGNYQHNSNTTFTICLDGEGSLNLAFDYFCVEVGYDSLTFHAGPSYLSPQIGPAYSGTTVPPVQTINSGCLTLHFASDANLNCTGWEAHWTTQVTPPVPPQISTILPVPACSSSTATVLLDRKMHCDSVYAAAFELTGALAQTIVSAIPQNCIGDSTDQVQLLFSSGLNAGGNYELAYNTHFLDACDSLWNFISTDSFRVNDCPIVVTITSNRDSICYGKCRMLHINVTGGDGNYSYQWSNGMPYTGANQLVCPLNDSTFTLIVDDTSPAVSASASITITVIPPAIVDAPSTHCQSDAPFNLSASPPGGWWTGNGITDTLAGTFTGDSAQMGLNILSYYLPVTGNWGCSTTTSVNILPINAGYAQAACPGSSVFQLQGYTPSNGIWSGPNVTPSGTFDPQIPGVYVLTYSVNGCSEDLTVYVDSISQVPTSVDTLCQSDASIQFNLQPPGGRWMGEGIVDSLNGTFDPGETDAGLITVTYVLNGCSQQVQVYVKEIFAGWNVTACPSQDSVAFTNFSPVGGTWSGESVIDSVNGIFDPGYAGGHAFTTDIIYAHPNGCTDTLRLYVANTTIGLDSLVFCNATDTFLLDDNLLNFNPDGGLIWGDGLIGAPEPDSASIDPTLLSNGDHWLVYEKNTCRDSLLMVKQAAFMYDIPGICEQSAPFLIEVPSYTSMGSIDGDGIANPSSGIFDPALAGGGDHVLIFTSAQGCSDTLIISVDDFVSASIDGPGGVLCYTDSLYSLSIQPSNATVFGDGWVSPDFFNPVVAGGGDHWLYAVTGNGECRSIDSVMVSVGPTIGYTLTVSKDTLCSGDYAAFNVSAFGGNGNLISYTWNQGLLPIQQQIVSPNSTTQYTLEIGDGCSLLRDTIDIFVQPPIDFSVQMSPPACYGKSGYAIIQPLIGNHYDIVWRNQVFAAGDTLEGQSSYTYTASIIDTSSSCVSDTSFTIPGFPLVKSQFTVNPDMNCIPETIKDINFIDLSSGANQGFWNFGDGTVVPYVPGENPTHSYSTHGEYSVILEVADSNGCNDKSEQSICLKEPFKVYLPTAFTVTNDGLNEVFLAKGTGIEQFHMWVYERSGKVLFESDDLEKGWDGTLNGHVVPMGVYAWIVEVQWTDKQWFTTAGTVTLIR